jgi:outer membrane protein TolC
LGVQLLGPIFNAGKLKRNVMGTKASQLSWVRYDGGPTSYLEVLNLQTSQFNAELQASEAFKNEITSIISLYQALEEAGT